VFTFSVALWGVTGAFFEYALDEARGGDMRLLSSSQCDSDERK
jgi:hypothetical protein